MYKTLTVLYHQHIKWFMLTRCLLNYELEGSDHLVVISRSCIFQIYKIKCFSTFEDVEELGYISLHNVW